MSVISGANLQTVSDSIAKQKIILDTAVGAKTTAATILKGLQDNAERIKGYDEDVVADCHKQFVSEMDKMANFKNKLDHLAIQSLDYHLRRLAEKGISDYWEAENSDRMAPEFAQIMRSISQYIKASLVFPPVTVMGTYIATGADTGTFTDGGLIDGNLYGPGDCEVEVTAKGNASVSIVATVTGKDKNGAAMTGVGTFSSTPVGGKVDVVPTESGKQFQDMVSIAITGGVADDWGC
jgi:hypothetical protein